MKTGCWPAMILATFYSTGEGVQLGGILGGVIDIGVLRTMLMGWVIGSPATTIPAVSEEVLTNGL